MPENRTAKKSRVIGVGFARFKATKPAKSVPPIFLLPGGPGGTLAEEARGTFLIVRKAAAAIPEPTAATLFTLGAVLTAARIRRIARS